MVKILRIKSQKCLLPLHKIHLNNGIWVFPFELVEIIAQCWEKGYIHACTNELEFWGSAVLRIEGTRFP